MLRLVVHSNSPFVCSSYGQQNDLFAPHLAKLCEHLSIQQFDGLAGQTLNWKGIDVWPKHAHIFGLDILPHHVRMVDADAVLSLMDIFMLDPRAFAPHWIAWTPVDSEPIPPPIVERLKLAATPVMMSRFGLTEAWNAGIVNAEYVPLAVDTKVFQPGDQTAARTQLGWPTDAFVFGMVADNKDYPCRKAFAEHFEAFSRIKKKHTDAMLYVHTTIDQSRRGIDLLMVCNQFGLRPGFDVMFSDQVRMLLGHSREHMATVYQAMDTLVMVSSGEGFGLGAIEAQACGKPIITGDWTATAELCFAGWKVPKDEAERQLLPIASMRFVPRVGAIAERMEWAYRKAREDDLLPRRARERALEYDIEAVVERYWKPVLAGVEERIKNVPPAELVAEPFAA